MTGYRRPLIAAWLVFGLLGLALAVPGFHELTVFLKERGSGWLNPALPRPRTILWMDGLRSIPDSLASFERPLVALTFLLLLCAFALLGYLLNPTFRLLNAPEERVGTGMGAHVDVPRVLRFAFAAAVS